MAEWTIQTADQEAQKETADRERLGDEAFEERVQVAEAKAEDLDWEAEMFARPQFRNIALAASNAVWNGTEERPGLKDRDGQFWMKLLARMAAR